ncbi:c-type cytochrome [Labrys monachus]|uniref:Mono/diheme cytochrome c family protein n=1 Tax=Labrys monachus TaxID=217067 RepID=A0ABU0FEQ2_9HYPH|nr:cytochrome c [Labrys monachus]MDQ0393094.1 mono/diheme cytochrome c family protein [Labrys monachus]
MKRFALALLAIVLIAAAGASWFFFWPAPLEPVAASGAQPTGAALIARGEYLTRAADCAACHTAGGGTPFAGGLAFKLPFGTIYSPNITPDAETGIGNWSDAEFVRALRHGVGRHGEDLYPAFPYTAYALLSTDDMLAIKAYLFSLKPVSARAPADTLQFPYNQRYALRAWKLLYLPAQPFQPDPGKADAVNRGAYLVEALAHCGECHTPRNALFALDDSRKFAGALTQGWKAPDITSDKEGGLGGWSDDDLAAYLSTGHAQDHGTATGGMAEAVDLSLRHLTPEDIRSVVAYLRTVPPVAADSAGDIAVKPAAMAAASAYAPSAEEAKAGGLGLRIFQSACASCHGWDGGGHQTSYAALRGSRTVNDPAGTNLVNVVLGGARITTQQGSMFMPSFGKAYSDTEIAAVSNYVIAHFGGKAGMVSEAQVAAARANGG